MEVTYKDILGSYLPDQLKHLVDDGIWLIADRTAHPSSELSDYSYLIFPFAKVYEGFLKKIFFDLAIISERDYRSAHFRVGKTLSPAMARRLGGRSAYGRISGRYGRELADRLWSTWKEGRNQVFHYFPFTYETKTYDRAVVTVSMILETMEYTLLTTRVHTQKSSLAQEG